MRKEICHLLVYTTQSSCILKRPTNQAGYTQEYPQTPLLTAPRPASVPSSPLCSPLQRLSWNHCPARDRRLRGDREASLCRWSSAQAAAWPPACTVHRASLLGKGTLAVSPAGAFPLPVPSLSALTTQNTRAEWCAQADKGRHPKPWAHPPGLQLSISGPHRGMLLSLHFLSLEEVRLKNACTALT